MSQPAETRASGVQSYGSISGARTGLVLSGGALRGAYEAGVVLGIMDALGAEPRERPVFEVFAGASIGALNCTFLAANAMRSDHGAAELVRWWENLEIRRFARLRPLDMWSRRGRRGPPDGPPKGMSLLDVSELERIVCQAIDWPQLGYNIDRGIVRAAAVSALEVRTGATMTFADVAPGVSFHPSRDLRRAGRTTRLGPDHVLASAALPLLFPARWVDDTYYVDGGMRFPTPIAPALRLGAERLVVISGLRQPVQPATTRPSEPRITPSFLVGKLLGALLMDSIGYDIHVLDRQNRILRILRDTLTEEDYQRLERVLVETRGAPYRNIETLAFMPTEDLGRIAAETVRTRMGEARLSPLQRGVLRWLTRGGDEELEWASYLFFDAVLAKRFVAVGRDDARRRADEIRQFFAGEAERVAAG